MEALKSPRRTDQNSNIRPRSRSSDYPADIAADTYVQQGISQYGFGFRFFLSKISFPDTRFGRTERYILFYSLSNADHSGLHEKLVHDQQKCTVVININRITQHGFFLNIYISIQSKNSLILMFLDYVVIMCAQIYMQTYISIYSIQNISEQKSRHYLYQT